MTRSKQSRDAVTVGLTITAGIFIWFTTAIVAQAQTLNVLYSFPRSGNVGYTPYSGVVMDQAGRLYGTNSVGGEYGNGTVYRLARAGSGWIATGLYSFQGGTDGASPEANVAFGPDGTLYGTTNYGGTGGNGGYGTVFNLRPPATVCKAATCPWMETVLHRFTGGSDGGFGIYDASPFAGTLVLDQAGNIYGTTPIGGAYGYGVVFELALSGGSWTETVLWNFTGGSDGSYPLSGVIFDSAGNLYGTASGIGGGGASVYELSPSGSGWTHKTLYTFSGEDIACPSGGVTMDAQGNLYGTTGGLGSCGDGGEVYELTLSDGNWTVARRHTFQAYIGPVETPTLDAQGNLYDTIPSQGLGGGPGEVFKVTPPGNGWIYTDFYEFNGSTAGYPFSGVIFDSSGNLYGTASEGGQYGEGIVWEITP